MPQYRRAITPGGTFFFTVVTCRRQPILTTLNARNILRRIVIDIKRKYPFEIDAWVLLPDYMHCIWTLPEGDCDYSKRWGLIKSGFTKSAKSFFHRGDWMNESKKKHREGTIWQRRYWEHEIRDEDDYVRHMDYVHYNPVKHGLVNFVGQWPYSTFHRYVRRGVYSNDWGGEDINNMCACGE